VGLVIDWVDCATAIWLNKRGSIAQPLTLQEVLSELLDSLNLTNNLR